MNGTEVARQAGYKGENGTLRAVASENLIKPNIRKEIAKRVEAAHSGAEFTVEKDMQDLQLIMAMADGRYAAAVRCVELQVRHLKMIRDKVEHDKATDEVSTGELVQLIRE